MNITTEENKVYHYVDDKGVVLTKKFNRGRWNSLGRTARALVVYDNKELLIKGIKSFFGNVFTTDGRGYHTYVVRYPSNDPWDYVQGNSRDHVIKALAAMKQVGEHKFVRNFVKTKAKRPCIDHSYTFTQKLWFKAIYSRVWSWVYFIVKLLELSIYLTWNTFIKTITWTWKTYKDPIRFCEAYQNGTAYKCQGAWRRFWYKLLLPMFAIFYTVHEVRAIEGRVPKWIIKKFLLLFIERNNHVCRMMCGDYRFVKDYRYPSRSSRWNIRLDATCNRHMIPHDDDPEDNLELAEYIYYLNNRP